MSKQLSLVSLFAGAGGMDIGFENAGFDVVWANDIDPDSCITHFIHNPHCVMVCRDIKDIDSSQVPDSDVVIGGFPCQGFSLAGPRKVDDSRNILYKFFVQLVAEHQPKAFVAENVKGLLTLGSGSIIRAVLNEFSDKGYRVQCQLLKAWDYGVAQERSRVIIVGIRKDLDAEFEYPKPLGEKVVLRDVLEGIEYDPADVCDASYSSRYMSRNRKRGWDEIAYTVPAMAKQVTLWPGSPDMVYVDKDEWRFGEGGPTRRLSYKECAAIQGFPSDMEFYGNLTSKYRQIGNAVPVKLAECIAVELKKALRNA